MHWARKVRKKLPQASLDTFGKVFWDFGTLKFFRFLWIFFESPVCTGHSVFRRKTQSRHSQTMFLGTFSDNFESFEVFVFLKFFPSFDPPRCTGDFFSKQNYLKTGSKHVWTILGTVLNTLEILNFSIFSNLSLTRPSSVHCARFLPKKLPPNMFKTCLIAFGNVFWAFWKIEGFSSFLEFFQVSTLQGALGNFFRKITSKQVQNLFGHFWESFCTLSNFQIFFDFFFEFFQVSTLEGALVNLFLPKKLPQSLFKTCLNFLGNVFGHFEKKWKFFHFSDVFPCFDTPGCTGQYFSPEKYLKTSSTHVWKLLRTFLDTFRNSIFFDFFFRISASFDLQGALVKKISKKISSKQIWTLLERFFGILKIWDFFRFFEFFWLLDPPGCTGRNFSPEKIPRGMLKTCLNTFGNVFGHFEKMKVFQFFEVLPSLDFPGCTGQFFLEKITSKQVQNLFGHF